MKKLNSNAIMSIVLLIGILIMLNVIGIRFFARADLTSSKMYSLSPASIEAVRGIEDQVIVKAYFSDNLPGQLAGIKRYLRDMLEDYRAYSNGHLDYQFIDPASEKALEEEAQSFQIPPQRVRAVSNDRMEVQIAYMGVAFIYGDKKETIPVVQQIDNLEYEITSIINRISSDRLPIIGVASTGSEQERVNMQQLYEQLGRNYNVQPVSLDEPVNEGVDALILLAPRQPFTEWQLFNIDQYFMNGGKAAMFMNSYRADIRQGQQAMAYGLNINGLLNQYGIGLGDDLLSDDNSATVGMQSKQGFYTVTQPVKFPYFPTIINFNKSNTITRDLQQLQLYYPSSVDTTIAASKGYNIEALMYTSQYSSRDTGPMIYLDPFTRRAQNDYMESYIPVAAVVHGAFSSFFSDSGAPETNKDGEPYNGPFKASSDTENRLMVVGDGNIGLDSYIGPDGLLFMQNAIDWLIQSEELIAIRSKQIPQKPLRNIPDVARKLVRYFNLFGPSILAIILGIALWQTRRIRKKALMAQS